MALQKGGGKLSGKSEFSPHRRAVTRRSGFSVAKGNTGGTYEREWVDESYAVEPGQPLRFEFTIPQDEGSFSGLGFWFSITAADPSNLRIETSVKSGNTIRFSKSVFAAPSWSKFGAMWKAHSDETEHVSVKFEALRDSFQIFVYKPSVGLIDHEALTTAPERILGNMHKFSPEALFVTIPGERSTEGVAAKGRKEITLKNCNRCARYLPVNTANERNHLSFSNHCTAESRLPCKHSTFSKLRRKEEKEVSLSLQNGFQLECRFCKKFQVNAAHNPQRTKAQMREDGHRRRALEMLVAEATQQHSLLGHRARYGDQELFDAVLERFDYKCFQCGIELDENTVQLDHTRPLALLWPLDESATALCKDCNTAKRDSPPAEFYTETQLERLAKLIHIDFDELRRMRANEEVLETLWCKRDWIFSEFFESENLQKIREGKDTRQLIAKALDKAAAASVNGERYDFQGAYQAFLAKKRN